LPKSFRALSAAPRAAALFAAPLAFADAAPAQDYPHVPEPMVFDMMRPLGAKQGELEVNTLATTNLSGPDGSIHWAPEVEYAVADGFAVEFEFPFVDGRLEELKLGLQAAFGTLNGGKSAHGIQYLGIYDRQSGRYNSTAAYMLVTRFNARWSHVGMVGLADIGRRASTGGNGFITNHSLFYDASDRQVLGLEINYRGGSEGGVLVMPQIHQMVGSAFAIQAGIGAIKDRGDVVRPHAGLRVIRQF